MQNRRCSRSCWRVQRWSGASCLIEARTIYTHSLPAQPTMATFISSPMTPLEKEEALTLFEELLRFPTISFAGPTNGSYRACAQWLVKTLSDLGLETQVRKIMVWGVCECL